MKDSLKVSVMTIAMLSIILLHGYAHNKKAIVDKANAFIGSLENHQKGKLMMSFSDKERDSWSYFPDLGRKGLPLKDISDTQEGLLFDFLKEHLSHDGLRKTQSIIKLEDILREMEGSARRDSKMYFLTFFGEPDNEKIWGWIFEGHHVSLNFTIADGQVSTSPTFLGANPAEVRQGKSKGLRVLEKEDDLGLKLVNSLNEAQQRDAIISDQTYGEIVTRINSKVTHLGKKGIRVGSFNTDQKQTLRQLLDVYVFFLTKELAAIRNEQITDNGIDNLIFAWAGSTSRGKPYYYRIQGDKFLIEFDNSQNNGNHIHTVWRDFEGDFGRDLIREHYNTDH